MDIIYSFSSGAGIVKNYRYAERCIRNLTALYLRFQQVVISLNTPTATIDPFGVWVDGSLTLGNVSTTYKGCYMSTEGSILQFYYHILHYRSFTNYFLYLLPNMLSYSFVINTWVNRLKTMEAQSNYTGLAYYYGMIVRNVIFFTIPEAEASPLMQGHAGMPNLQPNSDIIDEDTLEITTGTDQIGSERPEEDNRQIIVRALTKMLKSYVGRDEQPKPKRRRKN